MDTWFFYGLASGDYPCDVEPTDVFNSTDFPEYQAKKAAQEAKEQAERNRIAERDDKLRRALRF